MMKGLFEWAKKNLLGVIIACGVVSFIYEGLIIKPNDYVLTRIFGYAIAFKILYDKNQEDIVVRKNLSKKGLVVADLHNIEFVKNWDQIRIKGKYRYCLVDGGLFIGLILFLPLSLVGFFVFKNLESLTSDLTSMLVYMGRCLLIGYFCGCLIYFVRWNINEKRFIRLTNPLS